MTETKGAPEKGAVSWPAEGEVPIRSELECIPCLFAQAVRGARIAGLGEESARRLLVELGARLGELDPSLSPPEHGRVLYDRLAELSGREDPFAEVKRRHTEAALELLPALRRKVAEASDPLDAALRLAAMGNRLDLGTRSRVEDAAELAERALEAEPARWELGAFREAVARAASLLLIADNAGEIVFDRLVLEELRRERPELAVTVVVRGGPVINDATVADADAAGVPEVAEVMASGSAVPGFLPERVAPEARRRFRDADVVLAKGQGNLETLWGCGRPVFHLLQVKCPVVERLVGLPRGASALLALDHGG